MLFKAILETDKAHADVRHLLDRYRGTRAADAVTVSAPASLDGYADWAVDIEIDTDSLEGAMEILERLDLNHPDGDNGFILRDLAPAEPAPGMCPLRLRGQASAARRIPRLVARGSTGPWRP